MDKNSKIFVAGASGLVGSALCRELRHQGYQNILNPSHQQLDLRNSIQVQHFFENNRPDYGFLAAAKVGGIHANKSYPVEFLTENLQIELNVIRNSWEAKVKKLLFFGSACIYPKLAQQPIQESELFTGPLEPTNSAYATAKIAGIELCQSYARQYQANFITVIPTNLYGPNDNYHPENSHVIPGLFSRFQNAKESFLPEVIIWGSGRQLREFLHSDDLARACIFLMNNFNSAEIINIGSGEEISVGELAKLISECVGFKGKILLDSTKPDGTPRKMLNSEKIFAMGWKPKIELKEGLALTYQDFLKNRKTRPS